MPQADYIPDTDSGFDDWFNNFTTLLTAAPATYGLTAPDAVIVDAQWDIWHPAFLLATNPATRTSPTVAAKDAARVNALAVIRPYAVNISKNQSVSDLNKLAIGVNLPNSTPVPIPTPTEAVALELKSAGIGVHRLGYKSAELGGTKKKPYGSIGVEVWVAVGVAAAVDPAAATYRDTFTKSPFLMTFGAPDKGKIATYFARFTTRGGAEGVAKKGPWGAPISVTIL